MYMNLAFGAVRINGLTLSQQIDVAKRAGFSSIDLTPKLVHDLRDVNFAADMMKQAGTRFGGWGCPCQFRTDEATFDTGLKQLADDAAIAAKLGAPACYTYIMPGHDELDYKANFDLHVQRLKRVAGIIGQHGMKFALEFVGPKTLRAKFKHEFIWNIYQVLELCDAVDPKVCNVLLDAFHWYTAEQTPADITDKLNGRIGYVHVNDGYWGRAAQQQVDNERTLPCETGAVDIKTFLTCVKKANYAGPVTAEPFLKELERYSPDAVAQRTADALKKMFATVA